MSSFSERHGFEPEKSIQIESMDDNLRNGLWNALDDYFWIKKILSQDGIYNRYRLEGPLYDVLLLVWVYHFKKTRDSFPLCWHEIIGEIKSYFFNASWNKVYDFIEFIAPYGDTLERTTTNKFINYCNKILEAERSAYKFVSGKITQITNDYEIKEIEKAIQSPLDSINIQLKSALDKISDRENPDY
ncbi:MAG: AbiJ-NTD4 domain-containing protein [Candidatus Zixiibacteriota bacterium]